MRQRASELTGVGVGAPPPTSNADGAARPASPAPARSSRFAPAPKRTMVRTAIALLLQQPALVLEIQPPTLFGALRQPGIPLLLELIDIVRARPDIVTGALLEHFAGREEYEALSKLALQDVLSQPENWRDEFLGALKALDMDTLKQRYVELNARVTEGGTSALSAEEKAELLSIQPSIRRLEDEIRADSAR
jgi:DNA primase